MAIKFLSGQTIDGTLTVSGNVQGATFNGLAINTTGTNNVANQIVRTQANGYVNFGWINSVSGNHTGSITRITASNDAYLRYVTPAQFRTGVTDGYYAPVSTVSGVTSVATTNGITGGTIISTGTIQLDSTVVRTTGDQSITGNKQFYPSSTGTGYSTAAIELMASSSGASGTPPRIGFHWGGVVASNISIESNGTIVIRDNPGTGYEDFKALNITATSVVYASGGNSGTWNSHTSNTGTVTSVATGAGLTGGTITTSGTLSLDRPDSQLGAVLATYGTTAGASGRVRCTAPFNTNSGKMFSIEVTLYGSYTQHNYVVSAYMYSTINQWYDPKAIYTTTGTATPDIIVGRDGNGKAYISIANANYTGVLVHNMTRGYVTTLANTYDPWTITIDAGTENSVGVSTSQVWTSSNHTPGNYLPLAGGIMSGNIGRSAYNSGYQVGGYNNVGASEQKTNPIHAIGTSYLPTATALSNMYGIGYTSANASYLGLAQGGGWGLYVASDGDARIFLDASAGDIYATNKICVNTYANQAGNLLFSAGNTTTGASRTLNLRNSTGDPSSSDGSNSTGITWGQRTDSNPYYIIKPTQLNFGGGNYSKLTLNWHTGIRIGGQKAYGGTKFYNDAPDIVGETGVIMNVGVGNDNIGVVNDLTVGGNIYLSGTFIRANNNLNIQVYGQGTPVSAITIDNVGSTTFSGYTYFPNYLFHQGDTNTRIQFTTGTVTVRGDTSILLDGPVTANQNISTNSVYCSNVYNSGWFRNSVSNVGLYNSSSGNHFAAVGGYWDVGYAGTNGIRLRNGHNGTILGYLYAETSGQFGLLDKDGQWTLRTDGTSLTELRANNIIGFKVNSSGQMFLPQYTTTNTSTNPSTAVNPVQTFNPAGGVLSDTTTDIGVMANGNVVGTTQEATFSYTRAQIDALPTGNNGGRILLNAPGANKFIIVEKATFQLNYNYNGGQMSASQRYEIQQDGSQSDTIAVMNGTRVNDITYQSGASSYNYGIFEHDSGYATLNRTYQPNKAVTFRRTSTSGLASSVAQIRIKLRYRLWDATTF